jgi:hypothetical protein
LLWSDIIAVERYQGSDVMQESASIARRARRMKNKSTPVHVEFEDVFNVFDDMFSNILSRWS